MNKSRFMLIGRVMTMMLVVLLFACCSSKNEYCAAIPKDAALLYRIDAKSFVKAHNIDVEGLTKMMGVKDGELDNIGLDCDAPIYGFVTPKGASGIVAAVKDAEALTKLISTYGPLVGAKTSEKQGFNWVEVSGSVVAYDNSRLLAMSGAGMNVRKDMQALLEQKSDSSIVSTTLYAHIADVKQPLAAIANIKSLASFSRDIAMGMKMSGQKIEAFDYDMLTTIDCVKDKAVWAFDVIANSEEAKANAEKSSKLLTPIQGKYLSAGIEKPILWGAFNIDGAKYMAEAKKELANMVPAEVMAVIEKVVSSLAGDVTFSMPELGEKFLLQANVKNADALCLVDSLVNMSQGHISAISAGANAYCLTNKMNETPVFVGVKDNTLYVANSTEATAAVNKEAESGLEAKKDEICKSFFYLTLDMEKVVPLMLQSNMFKGMGAVAAAGRLAKLDRLEVTAKSCSHIEITLSVKDGKDFVEEILK